MTDTKTRSPNTGLRFFVKEQNGRWWIRDRARREVYRLGSGGRRPHFPVAMCADRQMAERIAWLLNVNGLGGAG